MKKLFVLFTLTAFLTSATFAFAKKPQDKNLKLNRGQVQSSVNKLDKVLDLDDIDDKGNKKWKKDKNEKKDNDDKLEESLKKDTRKLFRKALK